MATKKQKKGYLGRMEFVLGAILILVFLIWKMPSCGGSDRVTENEDPSNQTGKVVYPQIYITIDSLNMRSAPHLDSIVVKRLLVGQPVFYLNERSDFRQRINLQGEPHNDPWVKIRAGDGTEGWIYAEGARFYPPD